MELNHYTVIDVELANLQPSSICQIAIQEVRNDQVIFEASSLINPKERFSPICIDIHGIEDPDVKNAPTFAQYWPIIKDHCLNTVLVAHNAIFDVSALNASLEKYHILLDDNLPYLCTMLLAKRLLPQRSAKSPKKELSDEERVNYGFGLAALCNYYHIDMLKHHDAFSDVLACRCLLQKLLSCGELINADIHEFRHPASNGLASALVAAGKAGPRTLPKIGQNGVRYCFTGKFSCGSRSLVAEMAEKTGGIVHCSIHLDTDYLVLGNKLHAKASISVKEQKARQMIKQGYLLAIISEEEFLQGMKNVRLNPQAANRQSNCFVPEPQ